MWKPCQSFVNWEVNELGELRRQVTYSKDKCKKYAVDGYYYPKKYRKCGEYLCFGNSDNWFVHRAVAEAFIPNPENLPCVNHKDGNKQNNNVSNLEWVSHSQNSRHAVETGLIKTGTDSHMYGKTGEQHPCHYSNLGNKWNVGKTRNQETKDKISNKLKGNKNNLGHKHSPETIEKLRQAAKQREARKRLQRQQENKRGV